MPETVPQVTTKDRESHERRACLQVTVLEDGSVRCHTGPSSFPVVRALVLSYSYGSDVSGSTVGILRGDEFRKRPLVTRHLTPGTNSFRPP